MPTKPNPAETDRRAAPIASNQEIAAQLLRVLPLAQWQALRDFYALNAEEATVCAQYDLSPDGFRGLKRELRSRFAETQNAAARKPAGSAASLRPAGVRQSA